MDKLLKKWSITRAKGKIRFCLSWSISGIVLYIISLFFFELLFDSIKSISIKILIMFIFSGGIIGALGGMVIWNKYERLYQNSLNRK